MQGGVHKRVQELFAAAAQKHRGGQLDEAEGIYRSILKLDPKHADTLHLLGVIALQVGRYEDAVALIGRAIAENGRIPAFYNNLGNAERARGRLQVAAQCYEQAFALNPNSLDALYNLGVVLQEQGRFDEAKGVYQRVIRARPDHAAAHGNLGNVLHAAGQFDAALESYERALKCRPDFLPALVNRANVLLAQGRRDEAIESYRRALDLNARYPEAHNNLGLALLEAGKVDEAIASFKRALGLNPKYLEAHRNLGNAFRERGNPVESQASYHAALALAPDDAEARLGLAVAAIPVFTDTSAASAAAAEDFGRAVTELADWGRDSLDELGKVLGTTQPFYLAYRPANVTAPLLRYGELVCSAAAAHFTPEGSVPAAPGQKARKRLVIVSGHVRAQHPVWEMLLKGIISHWDHAEFELFLYHTGAAVDDDTVWARSRVSRFVQGPKSVASWVEQIREDRPDIIFYPEVGMDPVACALAAIRLAPLQAASWGHPVTTGLPSIDLFLSGELLESETADAHYREKLIRLPGTGALTVAVEVAVEAWAREDSREAVRFALPHQPIKFDPKDDVLLTKIAKAVGACEFWLAAPKRIGWSADRLMARLAGVFRAEGLNPEQYLRVIPWLPREQFLGFLDAMDVYLDCPGFSGYTTAWQALHRGLPIITREGEFLRQRLAAGLMRQSHLLDGIVQSEEQYVEVAARFAESKAVGHGKARRDHIRTAASKADGNVNALNAFQRTLLEASAACNS